MQKLVFTNGGGQTIDLTSGNFGITNWEGLSGVGLNIQTQQVPFQDGGVFLDALMEQREISVTVAIQDNNDLSARYERKRQLISALNPKLGEGVLVYTNDYLSRQIKAVPQLPIFENKNSNDAGTLKASVVFSCCSPYWEDLEDTVVDVSAGVPTLIENKGDVPTQIEMSILGYTENPSVENRTTNQKIKYIGTVDGEIDINTNYGEKSVKKITLGTEIECKLQTMQNINSIIYVEEYGKFYAVMDTKIAMSEDGINWSLIDLPVIAGLRNIVYSADKGLFIAITADGAYWVSNDGKTFERSVIENFTYTQYIIYNKSKGLFVCINFSPSYFLSSDGYNWEKKYYSDQTGNYSGVACNNTKTIASKINGDVIVTTDLTNWTSYSTGLDIINFIFYSEKTSMFIAVGNNGQIATSTNGTEWTIQTSGVTTKLLAVGEGEQGLVITGENGTVLTSQDGVSWSLQNSHTNKKLYAYAYNKYMTQNLIGGEDSVVINSINSIDNWILYQNADTTFKDITYNEETDVFIAVGTGGVIYRSKGGDIWEKITSPSGEDLNGVCNKNQKFIVVGNNGVILKSSTGEEWETIELNINENLNAVMFEDYLNTFIVVGNNGTILTSTDGEIWTQQTSGVSVDLLDIAFSSDMVLVLSAHTVLKSIDGITFTEYTVDLNKNGNCIVYDSLIDLFIINEKQSSPVEYGIMKSKNGENWVWDKPQNYTGDKYSMLYSLELNQLFACGSQVKKSADSIHWDSVTVNFSAKYYGICASRREIFICGEHTSILKIYKDTEINVIQNLSKDSDMGYKLEVGKNDIITLQNSGTVSARIKYRQKYIGV